MPIVPPWVKFLAGFVAAVVLWAAVAGFCSHEQGIGADRERAVWVKRESDLKDKALAEAQAKAKEGFRRQEAQEVNQHAQDLEIARLRDAAARNARDADRVRQQSATAARDWAQRLADSPTRQDLAAAAAAIAVSADVRGRLDQAAGELAAYAGAAAAAGRKCERDYDALSGKAKP